MHGCKIFLEKKRKKETNKNKTLMCTHCCVGLRNSARRLKPLTKGKDKKNEKDF